MLQRFARLDLFVPRDTREAKDMLCIAVAWLELLIGKNSIATKPYRRGLHFLSKNCQVKWWVAHCIGTEVSEEAA